MWFRTEVLDALTNSLIRCLQSSSASRFRHTRLSALHMVPQQANLPSYRLSPICFLFGQCHDFSMLFGSARWGAMLESLLACDSIIAASTSNAAITRSSLSFMDAG